MKKWLLLIVALGLVVALAACGNTEDEPEVENDGVEESEPAVENDEENAKPLEDEEISVDDLAVVTVDLMDAEGNSVGTAELTEEDAGVRVHVKAENLTEGKHGFHFHEVGICEAPDFESAGGHFNPTGASHGEAHEEGPHAGDLPNLEVSADGKVDEEFVAEHVTLKTLEENTLLQEGGTALVIHADEDDGTTQPSGNSGNRIACGVIR